MQSRSRKLWVRQLVMCTVPSSDRCRRFLQYNFMDPGWGGAEFPMGGQAPLTLPPAGADAGYECSCERFEDNENGVLG